MIPMATSLKRVVSLYLLLLLVCHCSSKGGLQILEKRCNEVALVAGSESVGEVTINHKVSSKFVYFYMYQLRCCSVVKMKSGNNISCSH